jgi:ABC-2 type transport system ATP-binding protein
LGVPIPAIDITGLSKSYGRARGIEEVDLQVQEGEIFGFIGPNGAGKSTTIRILLNLIFPTSGSARIFGMDVVRETKRIKQLLGYVPSDAGMYSGMTVKEFLEYCGRFYRMPDDSSYPVSRIAYLTEHFELDPGRKITDVSVGNRKKVSIVQSLLHRPKLLILDEPTTGLDPLMQARFFDLLREENRRGVTVFFSSHILSEVQALCGRVAIIREGRIVRVEEIETLRKRQLKKVRVDFAEAGGKAGFRIEGMESLLPATGNTLSFMYSGDPGLLVARLQGVRIRDLTIEEPSLEEIFMHFYQEQH